MKKTIAIILTGIFLIAFCACGSSAVETPKSESLTTGIQSEKNTDTAKTPNSEMKFESFVAIDNNECQVIIKEIDPNAFLGCSIKLEMENKSNSKTYMYTVENARINGVKTPVLCVEEIAPGKKAVEDADLSTTVLKENGISEYTDIALDFRIYDSNDWLAEPVAEQTVHIYPYGKDKAGEFVRESKEKDKVLADNDSISAILTGYENDSIWGFTAKLYFVNKTDKTLMYSVDDASVNGYMSDPFFATELAPHSQCFDDISWSKSSFEELGIENVEEIEFTLRVHDSNDWFADDILNQKYVLKP